MAFLGKVKETLLESTFLLILLASALLIQQSNAESIELDLNSDQSKEWLEVSCVYNNDYNDFWVFGYPVTLTGDDDQPNRQGFWTPGSAKKCEIHYYGGSNSVQAKSITFHLYLKGSSSKVEIKAKAHPFSPDFNITMGDVTGSGWIEKTVDVPDKAMVWMDLSYVHEYMN